MVRTVALGLKPYGTKRNRVRPDWYADSFQPHFGLNGHSRSKQLVAIFPVFQADAHGKPLHHFHEVAGGVFGGKQAGASAGSAGHALHVTVIFSGKSVDAHIDGWPGRIFLSCVSLKLAVIQMSSVWLTISNCWPGSTPSPTSTELLVTMPAAGA